MKAKSDLLALERRNAEAEAPQRSRRSTPHLPHAERKAQILAKASDFFAEYGLTAQTRALAEACGVSQRLLYSIFPNKAALLEELYKTEIAGPFRAVWFAQLTDRSVSMEERLVRFYLDYYDTVLTRRWLRLFLYASLAEVAMAPTYITEIITRMLELIVQESAHEAGLRVPADRARSLEIAWILHGAVSHLAIRRHVYHNSNPVPPHEVISLHVRAFLGGLPAVLKG